MFKKILIFILLFCNISYAKSLDEYFESFILEEIPIACGEREKINEFLRDFNFELVNVSLGRAQQDSKGSPVFIAEYYINKKNTETLVILSNNIDQYTACIAYRTFDLKQGNEIKKYKDSLKKK